MAFILGQVCDTAESRCTGYNFYAVRCIENDILHRFLLANNMVEIEFRDNSQHHIHVGQSKIGIKNHHFFPQLGIGYGHIDGDIGFSHPALSTCHCDDSGFMLRNRADKLPL